MNDQLSNLLEKLTGRAKQKAGELLEDDNLEHEGEAQAKKVAATQQADDLEDLADEKRQEANGHKGEQIARAAM